MDRVRTDVRKNLNGNARSRLRPSARVHTVDDGDTSYSAEHTGRRNASSNVVSRVFSLPFSHTIRSDQIRSGWTFFCRRIPCGFADSDEHTTIEKDVNRQVV